MTCKKVSLVIPVYNEASTLKALLKKIDASKEDYIGEIIVVDDASVDESREVIEKYPVKLIKHPYNKGYGAALKTGIRNAENENILIMDADGQHNPEDIKTLVNFIDEYDMVVGARSGSSQSAYFRRPGKKLLQWVAEYVAGFKIQDLNSGFRVFKKNRVLEFMNILPNTFSFTTTITLAMYKMGYSIKYCPIVTEPRTAGKSEVKQTRHGFQTILLMCRVIMLFNPFKIFAPVSAMLFMMGILFIVYSCVFVRIYIPAGALFLLLSSIMIFFFGALADQIASLRFQK